MSTTSVIQRRSSQSLSIVSWNINGIRSLLKHDPRFDTISRIERDRSPHFLCLQETKIQECHVPEVEAELLAKTGAKSIFWSSSRARKGYSGTAVLCFHENFSGSNDIDVQFGIGEPQGDLEGRSITVQGEGFSLVNLYVPNSGAELNRLQYRTGSWDPALNNYIQTLRSRCPESRLIVTGDFNVAHRPIDYYNPEVKRTRKQAGTTPEEQYSFEHTILGGHLVDTYRAEFPTCNGFSYYSARKGDAGRTARQGLRIDYVLTDPRCVEADIASAESSSTPAGAFIDETMLHPFSDHCPVGAVVDI